ncbi:nitrilase-related carbon-nitrogen hydrolase [Streptomyces sp. NPDC006678]|uniref:nitrilase-related carbon-nitrogen hydrolase n=1 Tax=unclassified Streptomyces TaxID=2593676 RepID=UPI0033ADD5C5
MASVRAAAVQISPVLYSRTETVEKVVQKIRGLGEKNVQLAVFSETVIPCYPHFSFMQPHGKRTSPPAGRGGNRSIPGDQRDR